MVKKILLIAFAGWLTQAVFSQSLQRINYLPRVEKQQNQVVIRITPPQGQGIFFINYRTEGMKGFQVRKMAADPSGAFSCRIPIANLYGRNIEYFVSEKKGAGAHPVSLTHTVAGFTQKESPEIYFQSDNPAATPGRKWAPPVNVNASLSTSTKLDETNDSGYYQQNYTANGNLRIYKNITKNNYQFDFDTNFVHIDPYDKIENRVNLSSMMIRFKKGGMQFEAGDVAVNETEFTTSYLNRRGVRFELNNKALYLNSFYTNSQQKTGFDGYGIPDAKAGIFGAVAGVNLKNSLKLRGMFMTGKDNLDSKTLSYNQFPCREGDLFSLWGELSLLKSRLQIAGEFSSSNFGAAAAEDELEKEERHRLEGRAEVQPWHPLLRRRLRGDRRPVQLDRQPVPAERPRGIEHQPGAEHQVVLLERFLHRQEELPAQPDPGHCSTRNGPAPPSTGASAAISASAPTCRATTWTTIPRPACKRRRPT